MSGVKTFIKHTRRHLADAYDAIIESQVWQTHHANTRWRADDSFTTEDLVYVSIADLLLLKGRAMKLLPKYVGPFKAIGAHTKYLFIQDRITCPITSTKLA
jgi:hypothetical protein